MTTFDIRIQANPLDELENNSERVILLDEELYGYYCFLCPFFEDLAKRTGQFVEREGDAVYGGVTLKYLLETITDIKRQLKDKPECWEQHTYTIVSPHHEMVYVTVWTWTSPVIADS